MARITIEDCLKVEENRFNLVLHASERARKLMKGSEDPLVPVENDKPTVVVLREIAEGLLREQTPQASDAQEDPPAEQGTQE